MDRGTERGPGFRPLRKDRGHGRRARMRHGAWRHRAARTPTARTEPGPCSDRKRGHACCRDSGQLRLHPRPTIARIRVVVDAIDARPAGGHARDVPIRSPPRGPRLYDPFDSMLAQQSRPSAASVMRPRKRRGWARARFGRSSHARRSSTSFSTRGSRAVRSVERSSLRSSMGTMLPVKRTRHFDASNERVTLRRRAGGTLRGRRPGSTVAASPVRRELSAIASLRARPVHRHDGGRRHVVTHPVRSTKACGARSARAPS